jgi:hypothetical protein
MKGDKGRCDPVQKEKYRDNYDGIFSKKKCGQSTLSATEILDRWDHRGFWKDAEALQATLKTKTLEG